ncbi:MAG: CehA/McbA family metallohydrolase [Chloroflexi bacterium]|nr:CehA/McbA family metallohydrolase [Chloroflexota bacterium]
MNVICIQEQGRLSDRDRQRHHAFPFSVPPDSARLRIHFRFAPGAVGAFQNLLTLSLFDPLGFRGAAHRWQVEQEVFVAGGQATPGFFPGPVYAGEWQVVIDAHEILNDGEGRGWCEYELAVTAEVQPGDTPAVTDPRRRVAGPTQVRRKPGWYKGDLHSHSVHCDGGSTVTDMARAAASRGLNFLALTSHNTLSWLASDTTWPEGLLAVRGMECTMFFGHANVLGIKEWIDWRTPRRAFGVRTIIEQAHRQEALFVVNHPCAVGNPACTGCHWDFIGTDFSQVDGFEIWNGPWRAEGIYNPAALELWTDLLNEGFRVTAIAGTDNHHAEQYWQKDIPFTWVYVEGLGEREILRALSQGRAFLSCGPEIYFTARTPGGFETSLPGDSIPRNESATLAVEVRELAPPATLWLVSDGASNGSWNLQPPGGRVTIEQVSPHRWCRLELRQGYDAEGDLLALTNPLYKE